MSTKIENLQTEEAINKRKEGLDKYRTFVKSLNETDLMKNFEGSGKRRIQAYFYKLVKEQEKPFEDAEQLIEIVEQNIDNFLEDMSFVDSIIHILFTVTDIKPKTKKEKEKPDYSKDITEIMNLLNIIEKKLSIN